MRTGILTAAVLALALVAAPAWAATPFQLVANGANPNVAVDSAGTAHVVWDVDVAGDAPHATHYCRILPGHHGCAAGTERVFAPNPSCCVHIRDQAVGPQMLLAPGRVIVVTSRCCPQTLYRFSSADAGATFDAGVAIGTNGSTRAALGPAGIATLADAFGGAGDPIVQISPIDGPQATGSADLAPNVFEQGLAVGYAPDGRPIAAWTANQRLTAAVLPSGADPANAGLWQRIDLGAHSEPALAGGGGVLWLLHSAGRGSSTGYRLRRFSMRRSTFGRARTLSSRDALTGAIAADPRGEARIVYDDGPLLYRRTRRHGRVLTRPRRLHVRGLLDQPRLAFGGHGRGLLVWGRPEGGAVAALWLPRG
jgi:hypothetical protein